MGRDTSISPEVLCFAKMEDTEVTSQCVSAKTVTKCGYCTLQQHRFTWDGGQPHIHPEQEDSVKAFPIAWGFPKTVWLI